MTLDEAIAAVEGTLDSAYLADQPAAPARAQVARRPAGRRGCPRCALPAACRCRRGRGDQPDRARPGDRPGPFRCGERARRTHRRGAGRAHRGRRGQASQDRHAHPGRADAVALPGPCRDRSSGRPAGTAEPAAPPDPRSSAFPRTAAPTFLGVEAGTLPCPSIVVASANDPYCDLDAAEHLADAWGSEWHTMGEVGHVNSASGLGSWPYGQGLLETLANV